MATAGSREKGGVLSSLNIGGSFILSLDVREPEPEPEPGNCTEPKVQSVESVKEGLPGTALDSILLLVSRDQNT